MTGRTPATGLGRLLRATGLGVVSLLLAASAHLAGGGRLPSSGVLAVSAIVLGLTAVTVTARRCRAGLLLALLGAEQSALHLVFEAAAAAGATCSALTADAGHHATAVGHALVGCSPGHATAGGAMSLPGGVMWVGHLTATVLTALLLARGEAWLWRVADEIVASASAAPTRRPAARGRSATTAVVRSMVPSPAYRPGAPRAPPERVQVS